MLPMSLKPDMKTLRRRSSMFVRANTDVSAEALRPKKENTYKMEPDIAFSCAKVKESITSLFREELDELTFDHDITSKLSCNLAEKIKNKVRDLKFERYKIAVNVIVGQAANQGLEVGSRCIWDEKTDNQVCVTYHHKDLFVVAMIFGVFYE
ncbi:dynein light chain Tctex-type protein 2B-like [Dreissena polymorpha]|nr:dynein light chain Tctex-type protein 2B-like [Dreissena polymorpha]